MQMFGLVNGLDGIHSVGYEGFVPPKLWGVIWT